MNKSLKSKSSNNSKMSELSDSRVGGIARMKLAVADCRLLVIYPFAFPQFKDENSRVGDIWTLQLADADGSHIQCHCLGLNELLVALS